MTDLLVMTWTFLWLSLMCVGGGLGVIPEMQRQVVVNHQWVTAREFVDGYTLAQLTPGPTMLVVAFVGYRAHGLLGAGLSTAGVYTLARSALHDVTTIVLAVVAGLVLYHGRVPAMLIVVLGGVAGWLLS